MKKCPTCYAIMRESITPTQIPELQHKPNDALPRSQGQGSIWVRPMWSHRRIVCQTRSGSSRPPAVNPLRYVLSARARPLVEAPAPVRTRRYHRYWRSARRAIYKFMKFWNEAPDVGGQDAYLCRSSISAGERRQVPLQRPFPVSTCAAVEGHVGHLKIHAQDRPTGAGRIGSLPTFFRS
jgi:hypothetical protein